MDKAGDVEKMAPSVEFRGQSRLRLHNKVEIEGGVTP